MFTTRLIIGLPVAAAMTFGLFVLMRSLIADVDEIEHEVYPETGIIIIGRTIEDSETIEDDPLPEPDPVDEIERPDPTVEEIDSDDLEKETIGSGDPVDLVVIGEPGRDVCGQPVVRVAPTYPRRAAEQGIEGYADVQFTVSVEGTIKDAIVIEQEPGSVFGPAAKKAVEKWRYAPCMINGKVQEVRLVVRLTFELDNS